MQDQRDLWHLHTNSLLCAFVSYITHSHASVLTPKDIPQPNSIISTLKPSVNFKQHFEVVRTTKNVLNSPKWHHHSHPQYIACTSARTHTYTHFTNDPQSSCTVLYSIIILPSQKCQELITETGDGSFCLCSEEKWKKEVLQESWCIYRRGSLILLPPLRACTSRRQRKTDGCKDMRCMYGMHRCARALYVEEPESTVR